MVMSSLEAGAEMMTFLAPASTWALAFVAPAQDRVELEQVRQRGVVSQVVHTDDLDVGTRGAHGAEEVAADATEAVDTYADSHGSCLLGGAFGDPVDSCGLW